MPNLCVLTDSTAQFPIPAFSGRNLVHVIPLHIEINDQHYPKSEGIKAADLPITTHNGLNPQVIAPTLEEYEKMFASLGKHYEEIITITQSAQLSDGYTDAKMAAAKSAALTAP